MVIGGSRLVQGRFLWLFMFTGCLFLWFQVMVMHGFRLVFHGSRSGLWLFIVSGWFFMVPGLFLWLFMVPGWLSWFQVGFSWFQVGLNGFSWFQVGVSLFQVCFHSFSWFQVGC